MNISRRFARMTFIVAATASMAGFSSAQQPAAGQQAVSQAQPGTFTLQVNTQIVVLDVVVNNKNGEPVKNLTKDDFTVYENKVPQAIRSFESTTEPGAASAPATPVAVNSTAELDRKEPQAPVSIIVLDELATKFEDEAFARYSLKKYLGTQGDTLAQPTMLVAVSLRNITVLRDYTTSKKEILDALDHHFTVYPWQMMNGNWKGEQLSAAFSSLMEVAEATGGHPGHKNIVWVGRGFPMVDITMMDPTSADQMQDLIAKCTNMLRDARVTLYSIDPAGLSAEQPGQDDNDFDLDSPFGGQVDFETMARATGGQAFHGRNDVDMQIGTSVRDGVTFYTLTYKPTASSQDPKEFRRIQVIMKDRSLRAVTREGYFAASPPPAPALDTKGKPSDQLVFDLGIAGASMMVYDGVPLEITRDPKQADQFTVSLPAKDLVWQTTSDGKLSSQVAYEVLSFDRKGRQVQRRVLLDTVGIPQLPDGASETRNVHLSVKFSADPPVARLRFVVRSTANGKVGADNFFLVDPKTLSDPMTGLTLQRQGRR